MMGTHFLDTSLRNSITSQPFSGGEISIIMIESIPYASSHLNPFLMIRA